MLKIIISDKQRQVKLSKTRLGKLETVLRKAAKLYELPTHCEVGITFVSDHKIRQINKQYRNKDEATDVISFALNDGDTDPEQEQGLLGDIVISAERAYLQAKEYGHSPERELAYLLIHGFLHLLGYDHMQAEDKKIMRENEEYILGSLGLTR